VLAFLLEQIQVSYSHAMSVLEFAFRTSCCRNFSNVQAPLPWDEERCVALARAIMSINKVCIAAPADVAEPTLRQVQHTLTSIIMQL